MPEYLDSVTMSERIGSQTTFLTLEYTRIGSLESAPLTMKGVPALALFKRRKRMFVLAIEE